MKKVILLISVVLVLFYFLPLILRAPLLFQSPEAAYTDFQDIEGQAEDMLMDPLILAGEKVVPLILKKIESPEMKLRRYAIHFLGNGKYEESMPALNKILESEDELDYFRGDALASIFNISPELGTELAKQYVKRPDYLGRRAEEIVSEGNKWWVQRSFWQALGNDHH